MFEKVLAAQYTRYLYNKQLAVRYSQFENAPFDENARSHIGLNEVMLVQCSYNHN